MTTDRRIDENFVSRNDRYPANRLDRKDIGSLGMRAIRGAGLNLNGPVLVYRQRNALAAVHSRLEADPARVHVPRSSCTANGPTEPPDQLASTRRASLSPYSLRSCRSISHKISIGFIEISYNLSSKFDSVFIEISYNFSSKFDSIFIEISLGFVSKFESVSIKI